MGSPWEVWDDMPPLVDANTGAPAPRSSIPPPAGATIMPSTAPAHVPAPMPHAVPPPSTPQYPWGTPHPHAYNFPTPQNQYAAWQRYDTPAYPPQSAPSPYIPRQPMYPEMQPQDPYGRARRTQSLSNPQPNTRKRSTSVHKHKHSHSHSHSQWPSQGDLSPLDLPTRMPDVHSFAPQAPDMHTPSSTLSRSISSSGRIPPGMFRERPQQWRHDFKFKSGFASMFRSWSSPHAKAADGLVDSGKLDLHPFLRYSKSRPTAIYDLRREPLTLIFRELHRPPLASDMDHSVTRPPTQYMRVYHSRLPWYIDIKANGAPYISLADFFQQLYAAMDTQISKYDFYNSELDDEDRDVLTQAYLERCRSDNERNEGLKQVDFLRGRFEWMGMSPGKNGMWRLKTA